MFLLTVANATADAIVHDSTHDHTHSASKRHGDSDTADELQVLGEAGEGREDGEIDEPGMDPEKGSDDDEPKMGAMELRCSHISKPTAIYTTPLLADFDLDGQLDVLYLIVWSSGYKVESFKTLVVASNLEKLFVEGYGTEILDFGMFLPPSEQPWTGYMGRRGDNVFAHNNT